MNCVASLDTSETLDRQNSELGGGGLFQLPDSDLITQEHI